MGKKKWKEWIYWFTLALAVVFVYKTLDSLTAVVDWMTNLFSILMPFIFAILIAYIFYIPARKIEGLYRQSKLRIVQRRARGLSYQVLLIVLRTYLPIYLDIIQVPLNT